MKIDRLEFVSAFKRDETVLLTVGKQIQQLRTKIESRVAQLNVPDDAPPELPRMVLQTKGFVLNLCQNRFQFVASPPDHSSSNVNESLDYLRKLISGVLTSLYESGVEYSWSGLVVTIHFPRDPEDVSSALQACAPLLSSLTQLDWDPSTLSSFEMKVGRREGSFFHTFAISGYEGRRWTVSKQAAMQGVELDPSKGVLEDVGIRILVDVNNKPYQETHTAEDGLRLTEREFLRVMETLPETLNLQGVL